MFRVVPEWEPASVLVSTRGPVVCFVPQAHSGNCVSSHSTPANTGKKLREKFCFANEREYRNRLVIKLH